MRSDKNRYPHKGNRYPHKGRYRPPLLESLARVSDGQDLPLADLTGRFVQTRQERRLQAGPLIRGPRGEESVSSQTSAPVKLASKDVTLSSPTSFSGSSSIMHQPSADQPLALVKMPPRPQETT